MTADTPTALDYETVRCCDDCGDVVKRRTRCVECGSFTCRWCFHHNMHVARKRVPS